MAYFGGDQFVNINLYFNVETCVGNAMCTGKRFVMVHTQGRKLNLIFKTVQIRMLTIR